MDAQTRNQQFRLGLFVAASLLALGGLTVAFNASPSLLSSRHAYTIEFSDAPGVQVGTPIRRSGVKIGEVSAIDLDDATGTVKVRILVDKRYTLRKTDEPLINQGLLSGDTSIDFIPPAPVPAPVRVPTTSKKLEVNGEQQEPPAQGGVGTVGQSVPPGATIKGRSPTDARTLLNQASDVLPSAQISLERIRQSVERFDKLTPRAEQALNELSDLGKALRETVPELKRSNDDVRMVLQFMKLLGPELQKATTEAQFTLRTWNTAGEQVNELLRVNRPKITETVDQAAQATKRLNDVLGDENQRNIASTLRSAAQIGKDLEGTAKTADEAVRSVSSAAKQTDATVTEAKATLKKLQDTLGQADAVIGNLNQATKPFAERSESIARNLDSSLQQFDRAVRGAGNLLGPLGSSADGAFQKLLNDPAVYNNLNDATLQLVRILPRADRALYNLEIFADKVARHPELIGVGGAVRPSAGLKEAPTQVPVMRP